MVIMMVGVIFTEPEVVVYIDANTDAHTLLYPGSCESHSRALLVDRDKSCEKRQIVQIIQAIHLYLVLTSLFIEDNFMIIIN